MSRFEPPTVLTRSPPSDSPDLPGSPVQSRDPRHTSQDRCRTPSPVNGGEGDPSGISCMPRASEEDGGTVRGENEKQQGTVGQGRGSSWRGRLEKWKILLTLDNSGSVARDHLASERTFLAYTRTSLTIASTGVALVQLFTLSSVASDKDLERFGRPLGAIMIVLGLVIMLVGVARYFLVQDALIRGVYPVARVSTTLLSFVLLSLILVVFIVILVAR